MQNPQSPILSKWNNICKGEVVALSEQHHSYIQNVRLHDWTLQKQNSLEILWMSLVIQSSFPCDVSRLKTGSTVSETQKEKMEGIKKTEKCQPEVFQAHDFDF
jgi:hypothetical protein